MILTAVRTEVGDGRATLRTRLEFADDQREPFDLWTGVPLEYAS